MKKTFDSLIKNWPDHTFFIALFLFQMLSAPFSHAQNCESTVLETASKAPSRTALSTDLRRLYRQDNLIEKSQLSELDEAVIAVLTENFVRYLEAANATSVEQLLRGFENYALTLSPDVIIQKLYPVAPQSSKGVAPRSTNYGFHQGRPQVVEWLVGTFAKRNADGEFTDLKGWTASLKYLSLRNIQKMTNRPERTLNASGSERIHIEISIDEVVTINGTTQLFFTKQVTLVGERLQNGEYDLAISREDYLQPNPR